ncbi:caspase family protein [Flammeovirga agarivorans]|uniref:Caspase family protein n=1 Tax=Flammeovirga agarivorans TaxID=2726742 RepID=A0A7X8XW33_9BACT|nr:caspase family protein [Flammeovirga agarivorans]NLR91922.1 caspase family protein [Flammeovirga agarivorans]
MKKHLLSFFLFILSTSYLTAQSSFQTWLNQKDRDYMAWKAAAEKAEHDWRSNSESEYERWQRANGITPSQQQTTQSPTQNPQNEEVVQQQVEEIQPEVVEETIEAVNGAARKNHKNWAVIVGVANYRDEELRLNYTNDDAYKMYAFFKSKEGGNIPEDQVILLIDEDATKNGIESSLKELYSQAGEEDAIYFYFSGHGSTQHLVAQDCDATVKPYYETVGNEDIPVVPGLVTHALVKKVMQESKAKYKFCIVDACHSGSLAADKANHSETIIANMDAPVQHYQNLSDIDKGEVFILSSKGEETSVEASSKRQGVFSYFLINALYGQADKNKDLYVTVSEAFAFTRENVRDYTDKQQTPIICGDFKNNLIMSIVN